MSTDDSEIEILCYGPIGDGGLTAREVSDRLTAAGDNQAVSIRIASSGGDALEGLAIHGILAQHPAVKTVHVDGPCLSAAVLVALAGKNASVT